MAILSWGKCKITTTPSSDGAPTSPEAWTEIDTPKENSTKITPTAGKEVIATEEGGETVDARYNRNSYLLEFDLFVKKGKARPFQDDDGVVAGEHAFRITPEDTTCEGSQVDRAVVRCEERYSSEEGKMLHYVCKCLKPAEGNTVKPYTAGGA